jgi:hypothetical protein
VKGWLIVVLRVSDGGAFAQDYTSGNLRDLWISQKGQSITRKHKQTMGIGLSNS